MIARFFHMNSFPFSNHLKQILLKQQIKYRFQKLHEHDDGSDDEDESES